MFKTIQTVEAFQIRVSFATVQAGIPSSLDWGECILLVEPC